MKNILVQQKVMQALESDPEFSNGFTNYQKKKLEATTFTSMYLCFHDDVIWEVQGKVTSKGI